MMIVASANDLILLFCAFELASLATFALAGFEKQNARSLEGAMKYFIIGSVSAALMLFGLSFVYGATGTTSISLIAKNPGLLIGNPIGLVAIVLLTAGFGFKMALVPSTCGSRYISGISLSCFRPACSRVQEDGICSSLQGFHNSPCSPSA